MSGVEDKKIEFQKASVINARYRTLTFMVEKIKIQETLPFYKVHNGLLTTIKDSLMDVDKYFKDKSMSYDELLVELSMVEKLYNLLTDKLKNERIKNDKR